MKKDWFFIILLLVVAGTLFMLFTSQPEQVFVASPDSQVWVSGVQREGVDVKIDIVQRDWVPVGGVGEVYNITPDDVYFEEPLTISMKYNPDDFEGFDQSNLTLGYFDENLGIWRLVDATVDMELFTVSAEVNHFSDWLLFYEYEVTIPTAVDQLIEHWLQDWPANAVGYQVFPAFSDIADDYIAQDQVYLSGGCGGQFIRGESTMLGQHQISAETSVDGQFRSAEFLVVILWQLGEGC